MLLGHAARSSLRLRPVPRQSYIEISNYLRGFRGHHARRRIVCGPAQIRRLHTRKEGVEQESSPLQSPPSFLERYKEAVHFPQASHDFQTFALEPPAPGEQVVLHGYLGNRSDLSKKLSFVRLTDPTMTLGIQIMASAKNKDFEKLRSISPNSPVAVRGVVQEKKRKNGGEQLETQKIDTVELHLDEVYLLNEFPKDTIMTADTVFSAEQRHLQLRNESNLRKALRFRSEAMDVCRQALRDCKPGFVEIETPLLFKSTPEGAREFLVPTRKRGLAYALPQSPQQYKQILMASGMPRYYQFARCFRDEDLRADRQPEFTQLDLEMSFAKAEDVMTVVEKVIRSLWSALLKEEIPEGPFGHITYQEAMSKYGSDKPDTRLGMEIMQLDHMLPVDLISKISPLTNPIVEVIKMEGNDNPPETAQFVTSFMDSPAAVDFINNPDGGPGVFVYDPRKPLSGLQPFGFEAAGYVEEVLDLQPGDLVILQARRNSPFHGEGSTPLGDLRRALSSAATAAGFRPAPTGFRFNWVVEFPLFSPSSESEPGQGGTAGISATHHPFTAPKTAKDVDLLVTDPSKVVADHYDLVVNGVELGGGSRRIHDSRVQEYILKDILKMKPERLTDFSHLLDALRSGCPPHAGLALGFDRLMAIMLGRESVRDVIAFPKTGKGEDVMVKSPCEMTKEALDTYHLTLKEE